MTVLKRKDRDARPWYFKFRAGGKLYLRYGFASRVEAQEAEAAERLKLKTISTRTAFLVAVNKRLEVLQAYATPSHYRDNVTLLKRFAHWRDLLLEDITTEMIRDRLIAIAQEKGNANANKTLRAIKSVFQQALNDGILGRNPCRGIRPFPVETKPKFIPTKDQISQILLLATPMDRAYLITVWLTAGRVREINNLTWEDVDFEHRTIRLWTRKKRHGHKTPRIFEMHDKVYESLQYVWKHRDKNSPYVFVNPLTGKPYDYRDKFFDSLCRKAGVPEMGYHALRHNAASSMAEAHVPLTAIQAILGHEAATTTDIYLKSLGKSATNGLRAIK